MNGRGNDIYDGLRSGFYTPAITLNELVELDFHLTFTQELEANKRREDSNRQNRINLCEYGCRR